MQTERYEINKRRTNILLVVIATLSLLIATFVMFVLTEDTNQLGVESKIVQKYVNPLKGKENLETEYSSSQFASTYGTEGGKHTLVLYDDISSDSEVLGILAANLATHFGKATLLPVSEYQVGQIEGFDGLIYQGYDQSQQLPPALIQDIRTGHKKVLWANANLEKVAGNTDSSELGEFIEKYGFDPNAATLREKDTVSRIDYNGQRLSRHSNSRGIYSVPFQKPEKIEVLGTAFCGQEQNPTNCEGMQSDNFPWAFRSGNITYVGDLPFEWQQEGSHSLAFADMYYDLLAPETLPSKKAAVRIEDVSAMSDPKDLRRVADFLGARNIPFQVAVIPFYIGETEKKGDDRHVGLALKDKPEVVKALKYMQEKGGILIQHGTTHQYGAMENPYPGGITAADYEFVRSRCSKENFRAWEFEECNEKSWVQLTGPVVDDRITDHAQRVAEGRQAFADAGLGEPDIFEVPHYGATPNAYQGIGEHYRYRYEQTDYFGGLVTGRNQDFHTSLTQILPYSVTDIYGGKVLPENLGNPSVEMLNNHEARPPALLIGNAKKNLAVRESTASFFFHPFLDIAILEEIVNGVDALGYTFVPAKQL